MRKFFRLNVCGPSILGLVMILASIAVIVWPLVDNQFSFALIPICLAFFVFGLYCFYGAYKFSSLNVDSTMRLTPEEKKKLEKQRKKKKKVNSDSLIVIVWSILAVLFGMVFLFSGLQDGETSSTLIGLGIIVLGLIVGIFMKDK